MSLQTGLGQGTAGQDRQALPRQPVGEPFEPALDGVHAHQAFRAVDLGIGAELGEFGHGPGGCGLTAGQLLLTPGQLLLLAAQQQFQTHLGTDCAQRTGGLPRRPQQVEVEVDEPVQALPHLCLGESEARAQLRDPPRRVRQHPPVDGFHVRSQPQRLQHAGPPADVDRT